MKTDSKNKTDSSKAAARKKPRLQRIITWIGALLLVSLIVIGLWPKPHPAEIATVSRGPLVVTIEEEGMTRVKNRYTISSPVGGLLQRIDWKPGAVVEAGKTVLAVLNTQGADLLDARSLALAETRVKGATAARSRAAAQHESALAAARLAATDFDRASKLFSSGSISKRERDAAQQNNTSAAQNSRAAGFALDVAEFELQQAQAVLVRGKEAGANEGEPLIITSPISGRILRVYQESERVVPAGFALVEVGDPADLEARIEVLSRDAVNIKPGARTELVKWGGDDALRGRVRVVEPSAFTKVSALGVEEQRVNVIVDFLDPLNRRPTLGDAYRVEARIVTWEAEDVLKAPAGALFQQGDHWEAFRVSRGTAHLITVKTGHSNGLETEIVDGLAEGDEVIVYPGDKITDGVSVTPLAIESR
ncbi:MAG: RND transporter [Opitutaceae bacterium]|nr:RND transporter [Opitutaceae bacterium]